MSIPIKWNQEKNELLRKERDVSFEEIANLIIEGEIVDIIPHYNQEKYSNQKIFILNIKSYIYYVPFVENDNGIFLKSIIPSRKYKAKYNM